MRVLPITLAGLFSLMVAGAAAAPGPGPTPSDAAAVHPRPDCTPAGLVLSQAPDGRVDGCLRLGNIAAGPHTISLQDLLDFGPPPRKFVPPGGKQRIKPTPPPSEPAVALSLSPDAGGPGTVVTVIGRLTRPSHPRDSHPNLCWDGCQNGLSYDEPPIRWTSSRTFRTRITIPAAPWIEGGAPHVAPLISGDYPIGIECIREARGCQVVTEGAATFHLRVTRPVGWCRSQATCARLRVSPARALPGQIVRVTGFVPLAAGETPIAASPPYEMVVAKQRPRTPQVRFTGPHGVRFVTAGLGAVDVENPPKYRAPAPLGQVSDAIPQIAADPADPGTVAWCAGQTIAVSGPAGLTSVPSATAKPVLETMGFSFRFDPHPECAAVAPLATATGAPAGLAAAFDVTTAAGAPPFYLAALVTHDGGQTWAPIPVPSSSGPAGFGGFRYAGAALEAVFARRARGGSKNYPAFSALDAVSEVTGADGQSWGPAALECPLAGPCVTFGPYAPGNCAMNGTMQALLRSTSGGRRWTALNFPYPVQACGESELVATSPTAELLVDSMGTYPVLRTTDGGATWHDVALPPRGGDGDLTVLPDGSLVMSHGVQYIGPWKLLRHGAKAWCVLRAPASALQGGFPIEPPTVIDGRLWWLTGSADSSAPAVHVLALSALSC